MSAFRGYDVLCSGMRLCPNGTRNGRRMCLIAPLEGSRLKRYVKWSYSTPFNCWVGAVAHPAGLWNHCRSIRGKCDSSIWTDIRRVRICTPALPFSLIWSPLCEAWNEAPMAGSLMTIWLKSCKRRLPILRELSVLVELHPSWGLSKLWVSSSPDSGVSAPWMSSGSSWASNVRLYIIC